MDTMRITPDIAKRMIASALLRLEEQREEINRINVFPVPDGDTGNNMVITLRGALAAVWEKEYGNDFPRFCSDFEEGLLWSISGNAGTISGAFLRGFWEIFSKREGVEFQGSAILFAALSFGKNYAWKAVQAPKAGTMLDVITAAYEAAKNYPDDGDLRGMFDAAVEAAKNDLPNTQARMKVLKDAGVVDAGAKGFVVMLEGLRDGLFLEGAIHLPPGIFEEEISETISDIKEDTNLTFPYEAQFILEPYALGLLDPEFTHGLSSMGDSLDLFRTSDGSRVRVHIHTDNLEAVQAHAEKYGDIFDLNIIDMREEIKARKEKRKVWIVSDAGADLAWEILGKGVTLVPFGLDFPERRNLSGTFYEKMLRAKRAPSTSQPSSGVFKEKIKKALTFGEHALVITVSSHVSGSYNSAMNAKNALGAEGERVWVFDSLNASCGQALLVERAVSLAQNGKSISEILSELSRIQKKISMYGYLKDARYMIRGGRLKGGKRVGARVLQFLQKFGFHQLFVLEAGELRLWSITFGKKFAQRLYARVWGLPLAVVVHSKDLSRVHCAIAHADAKEQADALSGLLRKRGFDVVCVESFNKVLGAHTGPGTIVLAWYEE